jgi:hypothetical protein
MAILTKNVAIFCNDFFSCGAQNNIVSTSGKISTVTIDHDRNQVTVYA